MIIIIYAAQKLTYEKTIITYFIFDIFVNSSATTLFGFIIIELKKFYIFFYLKFCNLSKIIIYFYFILF